MEAAVERLIEQYGGTRPEKPSMRGKAVLAVVVVDRQGQLVESPAVGISSFGWGVMTALNGELADLARWPDAEPQLVERIEKLLLGMAAGDENKNVFTTQTLPGAAGQALLLDLWASLFLVVPLVSTTFASVNRMLGKLPLESLGWLLVDEAGQALPQAAVGALLRTRRAVIVGDPVRIAPVVILPDTLTHAICRRFGVDPDNYAAPSASVQTLADAASAYTSEFQTIVGSRSVGVPLLVHRRCSEPMFGISNAIAYAGMMVSAKSPASSIIRDALGPSRWIHVEGSGEQVVPRRRG